MYTDKFVSLHLIIIMIVCSDILPLKYAFFGEGTLPILISDLQCTGEEASLLDCEYYKNPDFCDHDEDASLLCPGESKHATLTYMYAPCVCVCVCVCVCLYMCVSEDPHYVIQVGIVPAQMESSA